MRRDYWRTRKRWERAGRPGRWEWRSYQGLACAACGAGLLYFGRGRPMTRCALCQHEQVKARKRRARAA